MQQHKDTEATELYVDKRTLERYKTEETNDKDQVALCCVLAVVRAVGSLAHLGYLTLESGFPTWSFLPVAWFL